MHITIHNNTNEVGNNVLTDCTCWEINHKILTSQEAPFAFGKWLTYLLIGLQPISFLIWFVNTMRRALDKTLTTCHFQHSSLQQWLDMKATAFPCCLLLINRLELESL